MPQQPDVSRGDVSGGGCHGEVIPAAPRKTQAARSRPLVKGICQVQPLRDSALGVQAGILAYIPQVCKGRGGGENALIPLPQVKLMSPPMAGGAQAGEVQPGLPHAGVSLIHQPVSNTSPSKGGVRAHCACPAYLLRAFGRHHRQAVDAHLPGDDPLFNGVHGKAGERPCVQRADQGHPLGRQGVAQAEQVEMQHPCGVHLVIFEDLHRLLIL